MSHELQLLVEWSSPWQEFRTSIRPALAHSQAPLAGEAPTGLWPYRGMATAWMGEAILLVLVIFLPAKLATLRPYEPSPPPKYDVIYFSGDELPRTQDLGGSQAGRSGRAGGREAFHRAQTIHVARGNNLVDKVVDAPDLKLPVSLGPVANLLAIHRDPGPPPAEGLQASRTTTPLSKDAIVAPPPQVLRSLTRDTPSLAGSVIAPPPSTIAANRARMLAGLTTTVVAPPPSDTSANRSLLMTGLPTTIISPAPSDVARDKRAIVAMNTPIIPPSPRDVQRDPPPLTGPAARSSYIVPPPVSAPERFTSQNPKLTLPSSGVIAPPPSQVVRDQRVLTGAALGDPKKIVPPPVQTRDQVAQRNVNGLLGTAQIVPPPPSVGSGSSYSGAGGGRPDQHGVAGGVLGAHDVIPPPPSVGGSGSGSGPGRGEGSSLLGALARMVIPPPPNASGMGSSSGSGRGFGGGSSLSGNAVPPPPNVDAAAGGVGGHGSGSKGLGFGGPMDAGSVSAPHGGGGGNRDNQMVISSQPGSAVGRPGAGGLGSMAASPSGGERVGLGGSGGGDGIGRGTGPGSGLSGEGTGAAREGPGHGADPNARGGISPYPGPGGAGAGTTGQPAIRGVDIAGGSNIVNLPSFGDSNPNDPNLPGRTATANRNREFETTVVSSPRAGGAFNNYGMPKGDKAYTKYFDTAVGLVSMQYWDPTSANRPYAEDLIAPDPMRKDLPQGLGRPRLKIACVLDRSGILRDFRILEPGPPQMTARIVAALSSWKFRPAFHGNEPIEVTAILGFNIDTN